MTIRVQKQFLLVGFVIIFGGASAICCAVVIGNGEELITLYKLKKDGRLASRSLYYVENNEYEKALAIELQRTPLLEEIYGTAHFNFRSHLLRIHTLYIKIGKNGLACEKLGEIFTLQKKHRIGDTDFVIERALEYLGDCKNSSFAI